MGKTITNTANAISKLEKALAINPINHDALWFLGNGLTNQAHMTSDPDEEEDYHAKASKCFQNTSYEVNYIFNPFLFFFVSLSSII